MYGQEKRKSPRNLTLMIDWLHIIIGILIVVMAVVAFLNPEGYMMLFPLIFLLAAVLNLVNGLYRFRQSGREKRKKAAAIGQIVIAAVLTGIAVVSAISIWR